MNNKANLRDPIAATGLVISYWIQIIVFQPVWSWNLMDDLEKGLGTSSILRQALSIISKASVNSNLSYSPETLNSGRNWYFVLCDLEIWWMTLENNRVPLLYYIKLCASFQIHPWGQTSSQTVHKRSIWVKIGNFLACVTLKLDWWPWKTTGHLSFAASSFVHHFIAIDEFTPELQSGNAQFGSKSAIFWHVWPLNLTDDLVKQLGTFPMLLQALCIIS